MKQRKKNVSGRRKQRILSGILAVLIVVALAVGLMPNDQVYAAEKTSDGNTTGSYTQNLGDNSSTRYAGRVWTDKTVYTEDATFSGDGGNVTIQNDSDFLVAYSALATTQNITGKSSVPVDVVFVIDNSNSMDTDLTRQQTRLQATVAAVNTSIAKVMESHPDSRVAVVVYGSSAHTLLPLGHYDPMPSGNYIAVDGNFTGGNSSYTEFSASESHTLYMQGANRGTNIHMGVDTGLDILKSASDIGEGATKHVPALILLSDGAATYSGGNNSNWWDPSGSAGTGSDTNNAHALKVAMNAQYNKQQVNQHYGIEDSESSTACKIYTIGMGIEQLNAGRDRSDYYRAQMALDPGTHLTDNNDVANAIEDAWDWYINGKRVETGPWWDPTYETTYTPELNGYTFEHPRTGDISTIAYNDGYYSAENAEDVTNVFDDITSEIVSASAQAPTQITGDPLKSGYLTYTDPIGEYMEVKDIKSIIYGGQEFTQKSSSTSGNTTTYTFSGDKIESPVYGELNVSLIEISVTKDDDGNETLTVKIPAAAIPLRVNTVDIDENGAITNTNNNAYPARILYTVGAREGVDLETLEGVSDDYISANMTEDGQYVNFYSNKYSGKTKDSKTVGDATVTLTPAETNPFFYVQENTPLYTAKNTNSPATSVQNDDTLYYFQITYYEGNQEVTTWVSRPGSTFYVNGSSANTLITVDGQMNIKQGAPRLGYLTDFAQSKSENNTNTAEQVFHPVYDGNGQFTVYLGNNGVLQANAPKSLTVEKDVAAGEGLTAPDADFTFEVTVATKADTTGEAILTDADGQTTDQELTFDADGKTTFTLKDGQSMEILNIGEGVDYTVKEINLPAGFTSDQADNTKTGTVSGTDEDNVVTFTNTYNVTEVTTEDLGITLGGTKSITGRDFQADDEFVFTIAPAQATPNAPLPTEDIDQDGSATTATVNPTSGDEVSFEFGDVTFTKPGEYRYVIRETTGTLPGVDYDGALYRVNIIVEDNGDGTMSLASVDGGLTGTGNVNYPTNPFIQIWDGEQAGAVVSDVAFENNYSATDAKATIQGMKVLNATNSDRILADDDFTFTVEALGYNTDGGDQFSQVPAGDPEQPMPAETEVKNVANGNVIFGEMTFTQDMIGNTYGYKITEKLPQGVDENNPTLNGVTYDTSEKIVKVTVTRSDEGGEEHVVATVTPNDGTAEAAKNFTFTNKYEPSSITIGEDTDNAITVQKTFTGRTWNDSDEFKYTLTALDGAPAPDQTTLSIGKPASGTSNTATFGDIIFEKEGTYKYEITETKGNLGGVDYDEHTATVTVTVTENEAEGTLSAEVSYDNSKAENDSDKAVQDAAAFTNTYKAVFDADTTVNLNGTKELTGKDLTDSAFYFIVDPQETASGGHAPTGESLAWNPNKADGSIQLLKNVTYTEAGEYVYIIREQIPSNKALGMTYDESEYRVTVTVTDDQQGNLTASEPKIEKKAAGAADYVEADAVKFENSYEPLSITIAPLQITKVLDGDRNTPLQDGEFSFEMSVVSADPEDGITLPQQTVVENKADGTVPFGDITFTKVGTYKVQVKEVVPNDADKVPGVTYDTHVRTTTFTVTDNDGQLAVQRSGYDGSRTFTNKYTTTGTVTGATDLEVTKNFEGRANDQWLDTDEFTFTLTAGDEDTTNAIEAGKVELPDNAGELKIAADTADHKAAFGNIIFNAPGEYTFKITETKGSIPGVDYDGHEATFTVTATDKGDGTLDISTDINKEALTFTNTYNPDGASLADDTALQVTKKVAGAATEEDFNFNLKLTSGNAANVLVGGADGTAITDAGIQVSTGEGGFTDGQEKTVSFGALTFTAAGDYTFTVSEVEADGNVPDGWTYDDSDKTITVHVTDEGFDGQLDIAADGGVEGNNPTFYNTYYKPEDAKSAEDAEGNDISGDMLGVGDELTYTIDWVNNATDENGVPVKATIVVTDTIPAGTELVEDSISNGGELAGGTITWTFEDQEPAASGTVSFKVRVTEEAAGTTIKNDAEIQIGDNDPKTSTVVNPVPGKQETTDPDKIGEGTVLTYEITFTNTDGDNASANVVDTLTKGQGYNANSATVKIGDGAATAVEPAVTGDAVSGQTLTWDLTGLADNAQVTITFDVTITRDAGAEVDNTATVNGHKTNTTTTPYPSDDKKDVTFADEPEISIDGKLVGVGDELTYVIDWAADKDGEVTVTDKIPAGTKLAEGEDAISDDGVEKDGTITWNLGKKSEGDKGTVTFMVVVTDDAVNHDPITNQATIQIGENDPKTTNEVTTDFPKKEVAAEEGDEDGLQVGDALTYTIEYRNDKDTAATVTVTDVLPDGLTYVDGSASVPEGAAFKAEGQTLTWTIENAAAGAAGTVTFQAVVNENATVVKDPVTNKATITVGDDEYTTNTTGGDDDVYTGDLTITKEIALTEGQGTEIDADKEFTFTVTLKGTNHEPLTGTYKYTVGEGEAKDLAFGENGQATLKLKHGESAVIADLPEGASYSVAEADYTADGYTTKTPDNAKGTITKDGVTVDFINTYKPGGVIIGGEDTEAGIQVQKTFTGREWKAEDSFEFTIKNTEKPESVENAPMPAETKVTINGEGAADGVNTAAFGEMSFDTIGKYVYEITEANGGETIKGITYDGHTAVVTVNVTDAGNGKLTAEVTYDNSEAAEADQKVENAAAFTNTYDAASTGDKVPAGFTLTKEFTGHEWTEDYAFEFIMSPKSGKLADGTEVAVADIPMPKADENVGVTVENGNAHKTVSGPQEGTTANFDFGNITYDKAGTYVYEVKEAKAGTTEKGVTYSGNTATITVTVTDKDASGASTGQLVATATVEGGTFKNTYEANANYNAAAKSGLDITKKLNNRNMTAGQFTFTIEATGDNAADAAKKLNIADGTTVEVKNAAGDAGDAVSVVGNPFETMIFDETDDGVTYTYTIKEEGKSGEGEYAGYKLDDTTYTVNITATDKGDGTMTVTTDVNGTKYTDERATAAFVNTYDAGEVTVGAEGDAQIVANKTLKNDDIANYDGAFKFQVTSGDVVVAEGTNDKNGNITFDNITYTTENLAAAATADGSTEVGKANLDTTGEADVYTFTYSVSEVTDSLPGGVSYNSGKTNVTVTVTDDRHGKLDVEVGYKDGATSVEFVNTYGEGTDGTAELNLKGNKKIVPDEGLTDAPDPIDGTYTFEITGNAASDGTPAPMPQAVTTTNQKGAVEFGPIIFTMENVFGTTQTTQDVTVEEEQTVEETTVEGETTPAEGEAEAVAGEEAAVTEGETVTAGVTNANEGIELQTAGRTKTFIYIIKETAGSMPGVTNDTSEKTVIVTVTDEGDGKISVVATPDQGADEGNDFTFTNVYNVEHETSSPTGDGGFTITKTLTGRDLKAGEFEFRLEATDSDWWTAPTNPAAADGEAAQITFGDIQFTKPGDYTYTLKEVKGNAAGVDYDDTAYTVIAYVTDKDADGNYTGKLTVTWEILGATDKTVAFKNTYTADPTSVSLGAGKLIKGRDLKAGEFSFLLTDADGKEIDTAKNEENGAVTFKTITFDKAGTYSYEIKEVLPKDDDSKTDGIQSGNVTYDENIYHVTVDVKDNTEKGCLEATVTYEDSDGTPVFVNTYTEPKKETPAGGDGGGTILGVKTGDVAEILPLLIVMAAAIVVIIAMSVILIRRRRR